MQDPSWHPGFGGGGGGVGIQQAGDTEGVKALLKAGCAINPLTIRGQTPLHFATGKCRLVLPLNEHAAAGVFSAPP